MSGLQCEIIPVTAFEQNCLGDDIRFVPGHGPMSTFGQERKSNPYVSDRALGR